MGRSPFLISVIVASALSGPASVAGDLHLPSPFPRADVVAEKSCAEPDREIASLLPQTYSTRPSAYNDPMNMRAFWPGSMAAGPAYSYFVYDAYMDHREGARITSVGQRIEKLRRDKAIQRCFEPI